MAYDGYMEYNGSELVNLSRTAQLADIMGITSVWTEPESVQWIQDALGGADYDDVTLAPWYDPGYPASQEFAGLVPLSIPNLDDSTLTSTPIEYIGDGGHSGIARNATLPIVWSVAIVASTDRGADYGKRWLDRALKNLGQQVFCSGADLRYFRYADPDSPLAHRRDVKLTRGTSVTRKRRDSCSVTWWVTFTMTAADPYEYGERFQKVAALGGTPTGSPISSGVVVLTQQSCPAYDYSPIFDPNNPALVPSPTAPDFYPAGWDIVDGDTFERFWARVTPVEPSTGLCVPVFLLASTTEARMVRVSIWPSDSATNDQCDPLFSAVIQYLPPNQNLYIDGEQQATYVWDGFSPSVRRADSLIYGPDANPVQWTAFTDQTNLLVTLDIFSDSGLYEGGGNVRAALALVPKSD